MSKKGKLQKYLEGRHRSTCSYWIFSGDRHCSCELDNAIMEYEQLCRVAGITPVKIQKEINVMKVIMIGGYPGSGKSTIMRGVIEQLEQAGQVFRTSTKGLVKYMSSKDYIVLGSYEPDEKFPGTDRFPLNAQPQAQTFMLDTKGMNPNKIVFLEGDRLFNDKFMRFLKENDFELVMCITQLDRKQLEERRDKRSKQDPSWRKGRESKVDRMAIMYPVQYYLKNNTEKEQKQSIEMVVKEAKGEQVGQTVVTSKIKQLWT